MASKTAVAIPPNSYRHSFWDWPIAAILVLLGLIGLKFVNDSNAWNWFVEGNPSAIPIGDVKRTQGGVRIRTLGSALWHDSSGEAETISAGESIFTGPDGIAQLGIKGGVVAEIQPGSLVVVEAGRFGGVVRSFFSAQPVRSILSLNEGSARISLNVKDGPVDLRIKGHDFQLSTATSGATIQISSDSITADKNSQVLVAEVIQGHAQSPVAISQSQSLKIQELGQPKLVAAGFTAFTPSIGTMLIQSESGVSFSWQNPADLAREKSITLELDGPEKKGITVTAQEQSAKLDLRAGSYRWRLSGIRASGESVQSEWNYFSLAFLVPPRVIGPASGMQLVLDRGASLHNMRLSWEAVVPELRVETEFWDLRTPQAKMTGFGKSTGAEETFKEGSYQWHVRVLDSQGKASAWSELRDFTIKATPNAGVVLNKGSHISMAPTMPSMVVSGPKKIPEPGRIVVQKRVPEPLQISPPVLKVPPMNAVLARGGLTLMTWEKTSPAENYELQISEDPQFKRPLVSVEQAHNFYSFKLKKPGTYYWRARSGTGGKRSSWSDVGIFQVKDSQ